MKHLAIRKLGASLAAVVCCLGTLCPVQVGAVELSIHNELREDDSGALLIIEDAKSFESPKSKYRTSIYPGKTVRVTKGNVSQFMLVRPFERHKLKWEIFCPATEDGVKATITMLQIHKNELPAGCAVNRQGHWSKRTGTKWTEKFSRR